jgi:uncharacterized protein
VWVFTIIAIVYLGIVQGLARLLTADIEVEYAAPTSITDLWRSLTVPVAVSLLFVYGVVAFLGWWRPVFVDDRPVQRWVLAVPVTMVVAIVAGTNYGAGRPGPGVHGPAAVQHAVLAALLLVRRRHIEPNETERS